MKLIRAIKIVFIGITLTIASVLFTPQAQAYNSAPDCTVTVDHIINGTAVNTDKSHIYKLKNSDEKIAVHFDLSTIDKSYWTQFHHAQLDPTIPDILEYGIRDLWINYVYDEIRSNYLCSTADLQPVITTDSTVTGEELYNNLCGRYAGLTYNPFTVALVADYQGERFPICLAQITIDNKTFDETSNPADAKIEVTSTNGLSNVDSEWNVVIRNITIPEEWQTQWGFRILPFLDNVNLIEDRSYFADPGNFQFFTDPLYNPSISYDTLYTQSTKHPEYIHFTFNNTLLPGKHTVALTANFSSSKEIFATYEFEVLNVGDPTPTLTPTPNPTCTAMLAYEPIDKICVIEACRTLIQCRDFVPPKPTVKLRAICENVVDTPDTDENEHDDCNKCMNTEGYIYTALGCAPTDSSTFVQDFVYKFGVSAASSIAFLLMLWGGFTMLTSAGDPQKLAHGREIFVAAIAGLLFIILSIFILEVIGINILRLPGFGPTPSPVSAPTAVPPPSASTPTIPAHNACSDQGGFCAEATSCPAGWTPEPFASNAAAVCFTQNRQNTCCLPDPGTSPIPTSNATPEPPTLTPTNTPTSTPTPVLGVPGRPGGLIAVQETFSNTSFAQALEPQLASKLDPSLGFSNLGATFTSPNSVKFTGSTNNGPFEATGTLVVQDDQLKFKIQTVTVGGFNIMSQYGSAVETGITSAIYAAILPERWVDSFTIQGNQLIVDSHKRP